ncbi:YbaN family protein [Azospirillum sp. B21]|uniref:YbaN family protein n=1 Tax=Azospirillum sp. B21 TaxID=2607496 RepID=UPI001FFF520A|nr:YbaN family protein [Azospirillum sp. B21]
MGGQVAEEGDNDSKSDNAGTPRSRRWLWLLIGHSAVGLATAGAVLPVLPTVPFLLVAGWAYARSNPALRERLRNDPRFGHAVRNWQDRGAIPVKAKVFAVAGMSSGFTVLALSSPGHLVLGGVGLVMVAAGTYVVSRPAPSADDKA